MEPHHHHEHSHRLTSLNKAFIIGIALNITFVIVEFGVGFYYNSLGLLSDAGHNLGDVASLVLAMLAFRLEKVHPNSRYTYGYKKSTILVSLLNAVILLIAVGIIIAESIDKLFHPVSVDGSAIAWTAGVGVVINALTAWLFMKDKDKDLNVKGAYLHMAADTLVSVGVVASGIFMPADLTAGIEFNQDKLEDNMWGYHRTVDQKVNIGSAFFQNEWKNEHWGFLIGGRLDKHNLIDHVIFSPRANLRYNPTENINLRFSYSSGFRAPQAFDEDLHVENVGGNVAMVELADNLKEERSQSLSASADIYHRFGAFQVNFLVEGFYTKLSDVFALTDGEVVDGILTRTRYNAPGARVMGLTLEGKMAYLTKFQVQAGVTLQQSHYSEPHVWNKEAPAVKKMMRTPNTYGYFTATYTPIKPLSIALSGTYTGSMLVPHEPVPGFLEKPITVNTKDFFDIGLKAAYDFKLYKSMNLQVNAGVQNIFNAYQNDFDKGADRDSGYIYGPSLPRSFFAGVKISY